MKAAGGHTAMSATVGQHKLPATASNEITLLNDNVRWLAILQQLQRLRCMKSGRWDNYFTGEDCGDDHNLF
jgi:hypothetical protein